MSGDSTARVWRPYQAVGISLEREPKVEGWVPGLGCQEGEEEKGRLVKEEMDLKEEERFEKEKRMVKIKGFALCERFRQNRKILQNNQVLKRF